MSPGALLLIAADSLLLWLYGLDLFRERPKWRDLLLPIPYAVLFFMGQFFLSHSQDSMTTLLLPVDHLAGLFFLLPLLLLLNSMWFSPSEGLTLWGTFAQSALYLLFRTCAAALLSVAGLDFGSWLLYGTRILSLLPFSALHASGMLTWLRQKLDEGDLVLRLLSFSTLMVLLLPWLLWVNSSGLVPWNPIGLVLILLIGLDGAVLLLEQRRLAQQQRMRHLEQYLPLVEELVESVRARQHEYQNRMMAVSAAVSTADSLEDARRAVQELTGRTALAPTERELLRCDSKVLSGMLFGKIRQAELRHISVEVSLTAGFLHRSLPEWDWVDVIGVLVDNALEASHEDDVICLRSEEEDDGSMRFTVSNPCPPRSASELSSMFRRGWSTRAIRGRGYGLFNVRQLVERRGGRMVVRNESLYGKNYLTIGTIVP